MGCAVGPELFCLGEEGGRVYYWDRVAVVVAEVGEGLDLEKRVEPAATYAAGDEVDFRAGYRAQWQLRLFPG